MKTLVIAVLIIFCSVLNGFAQNRIHGWDTEKITSIQVDLTSPLDETLVYAFNARQDMDTIITFLKNVDFRELNGNSIDTDGQKNYWRCKILFVGQRDQVYLNKHSACIGKTSFIIDPNVIDDFRKLINGL
ncbi:hypothetical protein ACE1ET_05560 [Saccharicrinis sp. FJH62]|uniref:hypothetical protein n=1 Tax=Saccharicrinis sp. FJH62 TaxID=3344657 RepID=UPI0035D41A83